MTLHYKSERALPFNKFLDSLQKMFTIFEEENEPLSERAKVDELLTKCQNASLSAAVAQLRFQLNTEGVTFTVAANHLNAAVSQTPDYQLTRKIGSANTNDRQSTPGRGRGGGRYNNRGGRGGGGRGGRGGRGGCDPARIRGGGSSTSYYSAADWNKLSFEDRDKIRKERDKKGEQGGTKDSKRTIGELSVEQFAAIVGAVQQTAASTPTITDPTENNNAGNAFGGKEGAKRLKFS